MTGQLSKRKPSRQTNSGRENPQDTPAERETTLMTNIPQKECSQDRLALGNSTYMTHQLKETTLRMNTPKIQTSQGNSAHMTHQLKKRPP